MDAPQIARPLAEEILAAIHAAVDQALATLRPTTFGRVEVVAPLSVLINGNTAGVANVTLATGLAVAEGDHLALIRCGVDWLAVGRYTPVA